MSKYPNKKHIPQTMVMSSIPQTMVRCSSSCALLALQPRVYIGEEPSEPVDDGPLGADPTIVDEA